jgi:8-oxo-dGTP diphosphatase
MNNKHIVVVTGLVKYKDKFLIVKRNSSMEMHPNNWIFPGGKVNPGETLFQALKREIKEETNLEINTKTEFISDFTYQRPSGIQTLGFCFLVKAEIKRASQKHKSF